MCYISLSFSITSISSGNPSQISGLPFSQKNAAGHNGIITVGDARNQSTGTVDLRLRTDTNTALLVFVGKEADATDYDDDLKERWKNVKGLDENCEEEKIIKNI